MSKKRINKTLLVFGLVFLISSTPILAQDNVGIGTTTPNASALLDLTASNKGLLVPRVTLVAANNGSSPVNAPATGLLVYNTGGTLTAGFYYWNSTQWVQVGSGGSSSTCNTLQQAYDCGGSGAGRQITTTGSNPVAITANDASTIALKVIHTNTGVAISADNTSTSSQYATIQATTASNFGTIGGTGTDQPTSAIIGNSSGKAFGVSGQVMATATAEAALFGNNLRTSGGHGVKGIGFNGTIGETNYPGGNGIYGANHATGDGIGTAGEGFYGVAGQSTDATNGWGVYCVGTAGVDGNLIVGGSFSASGTKSFMIDHPQYPDSKFLKHFCVESNEVINMYRGTVTLNENGEAEVSLPSYFNLININFSYQLTPIGSPMPNIFVKQEIGEKNSFVLSGGVANGKVSWTVYAERNDETLKNNPKMKDSEPLKEGRFSGKYCNPAFFGKPQSSGIFNLPKRSLIR